MTQFLLALTCLLSADALTGKVMKVKGFGHCVCKVQSADRNQAIIIHTATGVAS
jgi:hypothetical protein